MSTPHLDRKFLSKWAVTDPKFLLSTATSEIWQVRKNKQPMILKVLTPLGQRAEGKSPEALEHFAGNGAVKVHAYSMRAQLLEFIEGKSLESIVTKNSDDDATEIICNLLSKIHKSDDKPLPEDLPTFDERFRALQELLETDLSNTLLLKGYALATHLNNTAKEKVVLHGDVHHGNVLGDAETGWKLIDPQPWIGEPAADCANVFFNPDNNPEWVETMETINNRAILFANHFKLAETRILQHAFVHGCLSVAWCLEDGEDPSRRMRIIQLLDSLI